MRMPGTGIPGQVVESLAYYLQFDKKSTFQMAKQILNRSVRVKDINIFYREAGDRKKPALLLLHGFPSSSVMFKNLMTALSDRYYLVAPDYPGFGFSDFPDPADFSYTFKHISASIDQFTDAIGLISFSIYLHDYGCPIGLRLCVSRPEKIERLIIQNGNAYDKGIGPEWDQTKDYWSDPTPEKKEKVAAFLSEAGIKMQYTAGLPEKMQERVSPELWMLDWERMQRPGNIDMQFTLNCDYQDNIRMFSVFQDYFRVHQPKVLVIWGRYDPFFRVDEACCYQEDLEHVQTHILEGSHMVLETNFDEVLSLIEDFLPASI